MNYLSYEIDDFCQDSDFIGWVLAPGPESDAFWRSFLEKYPHKAAAVQAAAERVRLFQFQEIEPQPSDLNRLRERIWNDLETPVLRLSWWQKPAFRVAATVAVLLVSLGVLWWSRVPGASQTFQTDYGQVQRIELSDGSVVTLNAHSSLKVVENLKDQPVREVWLTGEAYFAVAKRQGGKFIVHTPEASIEVLGTEFNVNTRRQQTKVVLQEGKIQLLTDQAPALTMKPGDMATVKENDQAVQLQIVQPEHYNAWKESYLVLDDRPVTEIVDMLEDTYGLRVQFENKVLLSKKLTGKLSLKEMDDFIENLSTILDTDVEKTTDGYLLR
ncbi:ferric-dicitrate binding protein FerR (iron transport regulator) [Rhabdobacter roseus]|uniref:Ferric-dicitrate binding protein FerR (Iron transport regulator) n=1 Tax=Rhabdobacter roseus TaxID=1655419 RepID=A0A840TRA2_9BACT|nr:FecR domain-containing protein [Rhabdobacter roseus]MBB5286421.1 ferric-dicitrate binding protein FerR (iron transport regulator) [Rhabdobacter roseus]